MKTLKIVNKLYPGRPNYTGPKKGWFAFIHHSILAERSHDITKRIRHVNRFKPSGELAIRLRDMMYLGAALNKRFKIKPARYNNLNATDRRLVLAYVGAYNPGHGWSERQHSLVYPVAYKTMTGGAMPSRFDLSPKQI